MSVPAENLPPPAVSADQLPAPAGETPPATPAPVDEFDGELPDGQMVFDRGYVERLRKENQRYRTERNETQAKLASYDEVFGQYDADDMGVWKNMASSWLTNPEQSAALMRSIADSVLGDGTDPGGDAAAQKSLEDSMTDLGDADLTPDKVQEMINSAMGARDQASAERAAVEGIHAEMRAAGIDPNSREGMAVLWSANHETNADLPKAIELVKADRQRIIDEYVNGSKPGHVAPTATGQPATGDTPITNLDDARRAADAFIRSQAGATPGE